ncbi:hypothetical protein OAL01_01280 [Rubripirellula sp.]|nr:hypothetical protein [Rubripirellula sp.]
MPRCAIICLVALTALPPQANTLAKAPESFSEQTPQVKRLPPTTRTQPIPVALPRGVFTVDPAFPKTGEAKISSGLPKAQALLGSPIEELIPKTTLLAPTSLPQPGSNQNRQRTLQNKFQVPFWIERSALAPSGLGNLNSPLDSPFSPSSNKSQAKATAKTSDSSGIKDDTAPESIPSGSLDPLQENEGCDPASLFYNDFSPTPLANSSLYHDGLREQWVYDNRYDVPTQHPWVEWGRIFYGDGITPRGKNWFGFMNLARPEFYMYGDFRSGILAGRNAAGRSDNWANRLNLDMDLKLTDTEHLHAFIGPIDNEGQFTRLELVDGELQYRQEIDITPFTGYFEGDMGSILSGLTGQSSPFELPLTVGLIPLFFQNGIWMEDAVTGAAFSLPARHSNLLNWSNFDATFFAVFDQLDSPAFGNNNHAAQAFGTAWFIEAYHGYIESGYAYIRDRNQDELSYHNMTASYTRRYLDRISNSVRVIVNTGQDLPAAERTADGVLLLVENSWITANPLTFVPYANFFAGWNRPQSIARAGIAGGILRNTGINFDTDGVNGLATLDASGSDTAGGSIGMDLLGKALDKQLLLEASYLTPHGNGNAAVKGDQYALGLRFQIPLSNSTLWRFDTMYGWRDGLEDVYGTRMEYRWKF